MITTRIEAYNLIKNIRLDEKDPFGSPPIVIELARAMVLADDLEEMSGKTITFDDLDHHAIGSYLRWAAVAAALLCPERLTERPEPME